YRNEGLYLTIPHPKGDDMRIVLSFRDCDSARRSALMFSNGNCTKIKYYTAVYSFKSAFDCNISSTIKEKYDVFLSHIGVEQTDYSGNYGIWQYSWTGKINGISGDVDLDYAYKDYPSIIRSTGLNGFSADSLSSESPSDKNTLEKILEHVSSIDKKMK
ncbi:MAG: hypothetical protein NC340_07370, partial [Ruminococcus flavefaciens]|nr:hypothetical protein [Ruminococcus flavefaciens]MCM1231614.1 hypothetical protein [Ruminococcus flavefaciens]